METDALTAESVSTGDRDWIFENLLTNSTSGLSLDQIVPLTAE